MWRRLILAILKGNYDRGSIVQIGCSENAILFIKKKANNLVAYVREG